jgi:hypothetical protein
VPTASSSWACDSPARLPSVLLWQPHMLVVSALGKPVQVAQEEGLVARLLPDDPNVEFLCATLGLLSPAVIAVDLIGVQQRHLKVEL